jgi:hypothetical protein
MPYPIGALGTDIIRMGCRYFRDIAGRAAYTRGTRRTTGRFYGGNFTGRANVIHVVVSTGQPSSEVELPVNTAI